MVLSMHRNEQSKWEQPRFGQKIATTDEETSAGAKKENISSEVTVAEGMKKLQTSSQCKDCGSNNRVG